MLLIKLTGFQTKPSRADFLRPSKYFNARLAMKIFISLTVFMLLAFLSSCSSVLEGKYVHKDGKESPYKPTRDPYEPPKDPTARF